MSADDVSRVLILVTPAEWAITYLAFRASRKVREPALTFMVGVLFACSVIVSVGALLGFLYLTDAGLPREWSMVGIVSPFFIAMLIPPVWWASVLLGRFR